MTAPDELADALFLKAKLDFRQDQAAVYADELRTLARAAAKAAWEEGYTDGFEDGEADPEGSGFGITINPYSTESYE